MRRCYACSLARPMARSSTSATRKPGGLFSHLRLRLCKLLMDSPALQRGGLLRRPPFDAFPQAMERRIGAIRFRSRIAAFRCSTNNDGSRCAIDIHKQKLPDIQVTDERGNCPGRDKFTRLTEVRSIAANRC